MLGLVKGLDGVEVVGLVTLWVTDVAIMLTVLAILAAAASMVGKVCKSKRIGEILG